MAVSPTWPGVYVQEVPSSVRTIVGVSTSTALFIGFTRRGPVMRPVLCTTYSDYVRAFGEDVTAGDMTRQVKLFFLNGGSIAYVFRVADGAASARVDIGTEAAPAVGALQLSAADAGIQGDLIRAAVTYSGNQPEDAFNLELFRWALQPNGALVAADAEVLRGLSMDPASPSYAPDVINAVARLVGASALPGTGTATDATSYSMYRFATATFAADWPTVVTATASRIEVSIDGSRYVSVELPLAPASDADAATQLQTAITTAFTNATLGAPVGLVVDWLVTGAFQRLFIRTTGNVFVRRSPVTDAAATLLWGAEQGGIEVTRFGDERPAPNGVVLSGTDFAFFEDLLLTPGPGPTATFNLNSYASDGTPAPRALSATWTDPPAVPGDEPDRLRAILGAIRDAINAGPLLSPGESWPWSAELWGYRLAILPTNGPVPAGVDDNRASGFSWTAPGTPDTVDNVRYYSLGLTGAGAYQGGGIAGADGTAPTSVIDYEAAYEVIRREVDLFNLLVLPRSAPSTPAAVELELLWATASAFCQERRAFLLMEPPVGWTGAQVPSNEITTLRAGLSKQYAGLYYPRITIREDRLRIDLGATGAIAGLMARTDGERGVWKAPAGSEADLRGVVGVAEKLSNPENGMLNPRGINIVRLFATGIVSWGARTLDGDDNFASQYKYVPVRRLALFLEESLYRGLQWVVFEPNDAPLWAQIRLNVGAFMQGLFRKGAFQGVTPQEAYFVKCDTETTPQADRNLGIVNVWVGFAPLNPAEFVILSIQQMAGQVEV